MANDVWRGCRKLLPLSLFSAWRQVGVFHYSLFFLISCFLIACFISSFLWGCLKSLHPTSHTSTSAASPPLCPHFFYIPYYPHLLYLSRPAVKEEECLPKGQEFTENVCATQRQGRKSLFCDTSHQICASSLLFIDMKKILEKSWRNFKWTGKIMVILM